MNEVIFNEKIKSPSVVLITEDGKNLGKMLKSVALKMATDKNMDLVQVANGESPVCKIADVSKLKYERKKIDKKNKTHHAMKEIKMGLDIAEHDKNVKISKTKELIKKGHKVKFTLELKGKQRRTEYHRDFANNKLKEIISSLSDICTPSSFFNGDFSIGAIFTAM